MRAIASAHASTRATLFMHVKNSTRHFCYDTYCLGQWKEENERKNKTFVNLSLAWMLYFYAWLQNEGKFLVWSIFLLEPWQSNFSNPETYSKPCQTYKMERFAKIVND